MHSRRTTCLTITLFVAAALTACSGEKNAGEAARSTTTRGVPTTIAAPELLPSTSTTALAGRPEWLGTRVLPKRPDGFGEIQPTPPELQDRRIATADLLPPPAGDGFTSTVGAVPDDVRARSTWSPECPVGLADLRYVTVAFWGFDGKPHTGELLLHRSVTDTVVAAFRRLHELRFPIEEMRIARADELDAPPTGDGNNTGAFVCRASRGTTRWSGHAYGKAVDINPFHNPYVKGDVVVPELASAYRDRTRVRPGMFNTGRAEVAAFTEQGWGWGGAWKSLKDYMHFSADGR